MSLIKWFYNFKADKHGYKYYSFIDLFKFKSPIADLKKIVALLRGVLSSWENDYTTLVLNLFYSSNFDNSFYLLKS